MIMEVLFYSQAMVSSSPEDILFKEEPPKLAHKPKNRCDAQEVKMMKALDNLRWPLSGIAGILVIVFYCVLTLISAAITPHPWSPWPYLSDFGNTVYNPNGAIFYNLACILTGLALIPFYIGIYKWYTKTTWRNILLIVTQFIGLASAVSLIMIGVFYENSPAEFTIPGGAHEFWSMVFFVLNLLVLIFANVSLLTHPKFIKLIAVYGFIVAIINLALVVLPSSSIIEWFTVFTALGFAGLLVINMMKAFKPSAKAK